ncbi:MAG: M48 family metallopeptidase [Porcipelethomonas sp.]
MNCIKINGKELYYIIERKSVKNINMRLKTDGIVYVSASKKIPEKYIKSLLENNAEKFLAAAEKQKQNQDIQTDISKTRYLGIEYSIEIIKSDENTADFDGTKFTVHTPDISDKENILFLILKWKSDKCKKLYSEINIDVRSRFRQSGYNVPLAIITIKLMKTRWGSCSYNTGRMSMNLKLIDYPKECIYAVFCHEYMHFIHQNHSRDFHNDLEKIYPEYKHADMLLKSIPF